jgi:hypothetical protein
MSNLKKAIGNIRATGISVLVIPRDGDLAGLSYGSPGDPISRYIDLYGDPSDPLMIYVLAHEVAHHLYGDLTAWNSLPAWSVEYRADQFALKAIREGIPDLYPAAEAMAKQNTARIMQEYIDADVWHHVDLKIADWAGCDVPDDMRRMLTEANDEPLGEVEF